MFLTAVQLCCLQEHICLGSPTAQPSCAVRHRAQKGGSARKKTPCTKKWKGKTVITMAAKENEQRQLEIDTNNTRAP